MSPRTRALALAIVILSAACSPALPSGPRVYVTNERSGDLTVIDARTNRVLATVPLGKRPRGIRASPDGKTLDVALSGSPAAPPGVDESTLPPPDRSADGIGVRHSADEAGQGDPCRHRSRPAPFSRFSEPKRRSLLNL